MLSNANLEITVELPRRASKPLVELVKLSESVPGSTLVRDGVLT